MTNELEKQFFDTFGIEPIEEKYCYWECKKPELEKVPCNNTECEHYRHKIHYPYISDHILLELICIVLNTFQTFEVYRIMDIDSLKEKILKLSMLAQDDVYSQVRTLFKEG